jgi:tetratricopeptide (TPR) repeat protein
MKKIMFVAIVLLSLMVCVTSPIWAGGFDDANAGIEAAKVGEYDKAIRLFTKAIESGELSHESLGKAYFNRGYAWRKKGNYDKAIADFTKVIEIDPQDVYAYYDRGYAWEDKGDYNKAIADFTKVIEIDPQYADAYYDRGYAWGKKGDYDKAIADFTKVIEIDPQDVYAYYDRGYAWEDKGDYNKAIADFTKVIEIDPQHADAYNSLAWLKATCPDDRNRDGKRAVEFAEKAVKLEETANRLDTLAAAYAEAGRFQDAIQTQERAIKLVEKEGETEDLAEFKKHLDSYKAGKPWREK